MKTEFKIEKCSEENFAESFSGDMARDFEVLR